MLQSHRPKYYSELGSKEHLRNPNLQAWYGNVLSQKTLKRLTSRQKWMQKWTLILKAKVGLLG